MGWKDWPYWLKGGLIGLFLLIIVYPLLMILWSGKMPDIGNIFVLYAFSPLFILNILGQCKGEFCSGAPVWARFIAITFTWGLPIITALIGLIIGKIKPRKQTPPSSKK